MPRSDVSGRNSGWAARRRADARPEEHRPARLARRTERSLDMKISSVFVLLALIVAGAILASPALATPTTTSLANSAPFSTPIGDTVNSSYLGSSAAVTFSALRITCPSNYTDYVPSTHTRALITQLRFGDGATSCNSDLGVLSATVRTRAGSTTNYPLHATSMVARSATSWNGTIEILAGSEISLSAVDALGRRCSFTLGAQSIRVVGTTAAASIALNDPTVRFNSDAGQSVGCPASGTMTVTGTYTYRPRTTRDSVRMTVAS